MMKEKKKEGRQKKKMIERFIDGNSYHSYLVSHYG